MYPFRMVRVIPCQYGRYGLVWSKIFFVSSFFIHERAYPYSSKYGTAANATASATTIPLV